MCSCLPVTFDPHVKSGMAFFEIFCDTTCNLKSQLFFFKKAPAIGDPWNLVYIYGVHIMWFEASEKPIFGFMSCWRDILNRYFNLFPHHTKIITNTAQRTPSNLFWTRAPIQDASSPYPRHLLFLLGRSKDGADQAGHRGGVVYFWSTQDGPSHHHI